jgi:hypothetical protein
VALPRQSFRPVPCRLAPFACGVFRRPISEIAQTPHVTVFACALRIAVVFACGSRSAVTAGALQHTASPDAAAKGCKKSNLSRYPLRSAARHADGIARALPCHSA